MTKTAARSAVQWSAPPPRSQVIPLCVILSLRERAKNLPGFQLCWDTAVEMLRSCLCVPARRQGAQHDRSSDAHHDRTTVCMTASPLSVTG